MQGFHNVALQDALRAVKSDGVWHPEWDWKSLRHTAATWQLSAPPTGLGLDEVAVSTVLGHSSSTFTWDRYVGTLGDTANLAAQAMASFDPNGR